MTNLPARIEALLAAAKHHDDQTHVSQGCLYCRAQNTLEWLAPAALQSVAELVKALESLLVAAAPDFTATAEGYDAAAIQAKFVQIAAAKAHQALRATEERLGGRLG